jgi:hypothetical protein
MLLNLSKTLSPSLPSGDHIVTYVTELFWGANEHKCTKPLGPVVALHQVFHRQVLVQIIAASDNCKINIQCMWSYCLIVGTINTGSKYRIIVANSVETFDVKLYLYSFFIHQVILLNYPIDFNILFTYHFQISVILERTKFWFVHNRQANSITDSFASSSYIKEPGARVAWMLTGLSVILPGQSHMCLFQSYKPEFLGLPLKLQESLLANRVYLYVWLYDL